MADLESRLVYKGFEAWVVVGDKSLSNFGVECKESTREVSAWIPSEAGKTFTVCYRKSGHDSCGYTADLQLDGHQILSRKYREKPERSVSSVMRYSSIAISPTKIRDFMFNPAVLTDDDAYIDHPSSTGIGEIKVILQLAEVNIRNRPLLRPRNTGPLPEIQKIHERSKKGLVHQIQFSETKEGPHRSEVKWSKWHAKPIGNPITFVFKYRSLDMLQANGIAPSLTPPAELTEDGPRRSGASLESSKSSIPEQVISNVKQEDGGEGDDDDDEIMKARALLAELEERRKQKRARKEIDRPSNKVKKEFTSLFQHGEVIDLTEPNEIRPKKRVKTESTSRFAPGEIIDLT